MSNVDDLIASQAAASKSAARFSVGIAAHPTDPKRNVYSVSVSGKSAATIDIAEHDDPIIAKLHCHILESALGWKMGKCVQDGCEGELVGAALGGEYVPHPETGAPVQIPENNIAVKCAVCKRHLLVTRVEGGDVHGVSLEIMAQLTEDEHETKRVEEALDASTR